MDDDDDDLEEGCEDDADGCIGCCDECGCNVYRSTAAWRGSFLYCDQCDWYLHAAYKDKAAP